MATTKPSILWIEGWTTGDAGELAATMQEKETKAMSGGQYGFDLCAVLGMDPDAFESVWLAKALGQRWALSSAFEGSWIMCEIRT
jgi:hypothetical protein